MRLISPSGAYVRAEGALAEKLLTRGYIDAAPPAPKPKPQRRKRTPKPKEA